MTGTFAADPAVTGGIVNRTIVTVTTPILTRLVDADRVALEVVAVIPVFNGEAVLGECLGALLATSSVALVVIDDGSCDCSVAIALATAAAFPARVRVVVPGGNRGFAASVNRGVTEAFAMGAATVVLVNQDCVVSKGWLSPMVSALDDHGIGIVGARLLSADGVTLQHAGGRIEANGLTNHFGRGSRDASAWRDLCDVDYVCGALVAFRSETWRRFGALDEGFAPAYFEEVEWCARLRRAGLRVVYVPGSEARHFEATCSVAGSRLYLQRYHRSRLRYVVRYHVGNVGAGRWLIAEAKWLARLRRWSDLAPVLAAYARVPHLVLELACERGREFLGGELRRDRATRGSGAESLRDRPMMATSTHSSRAVAQESR